MYFHLKLSALQSYTYKICTHVINQNTMKATFNTNYIVINLRIMCVNCNSIFHTLKKSLITLFRVFGTQKFTISIIYRFTPVIISNC